MSPQVRPPTDFEGRADANFGVSQLDFGCSPLSLTAKHGVLGLRTASHAKPAAQVSSLQALQPGCAACKTPRGHTENLSLTLKMGSPVSQLQSVTEADIVGLECNASLLDSITDEPHSTGRDRRTPADQALQPESPPNYDQQSGILAGNEDRHEGVQAGMQVSQGIVQPPQKVPAYILDETLVDPACSNIPENADEHGEMDQVPMEQTYAMPMEETLALHGLDALRHEIAGLSDQRDAVRGCNEIGERFGAPSSHVDGVALQTEDEEIHRSYNELIGHLHPDPRSRAQQSSAPPRRHSSPCQAALKPGKYAETQIMPGKVSVSLSLI